MSIPCSRGEIRGVISAWVSETGQKVDPGAPPSGGRRIDDDGVPDGMPKDGNATMLAIEVAGASKASKGGGKASKTSGKKTTAKKKKGGH